MNSNVQFPIIGILLAPSSPDSSNGPLSILSWVGFLDLERSFCYLLRGIMTEVTRRLMSRNRTIDDEIVIDRAMAVFWRRGYAATSMRDLSEASGLGAAALYNRFTDKDGLFVEVLRRYADKGLFERLARLSAIVDPIEAITGFFDELIDISANDPDRRGCLLVNTALDGAPMSQAVRDLVRQRLGEVQTFFQVQLQRTQDSCRIGLEVQPILAAEVLLGTVLAIRVFARLDPDRGRLRRLADNALAPVIPARKAIMQ
jgi:TetR/AcrR family transcriptional repressor of nem operon